MHRPSPALRNTAIGFTILELMVTLTIISAIIALVTIGYRKYLAKAEFIQCKSKIKAIGLKLEAYYADHDYIWPQAPEDLEDDEYVKFYHELLMGKDKYDAVSQDWICPSHEKELKKTYQGKENERPKWEASYMPIDFDDQPGRPRENYQPWVIESYGHEEGHNMYMSDGTVTTFLHKPINIPKPKESNKAP